MKVYEGVGGVRLRKKSRSIAIGVFDGVHRGHQVILSRMLRRSHDSRLISMVVTFDPHPLKILEPRSAHPILMSLPHRLRLFEEMGISEALVIRFTRTFSRMDRERFLSDLLIGRLGLGALSVGYDFRFGTRGLGDLEFLRAKACERNFLLSVCRPLKYGKQIISSTWIRRLILSGDLRTASLMLGRPVSVYGTVIHGRGRGRASGFPTANLNPHHETIPPDGVYAVWGELGGRCLKGMLHIGARPTYGEGERSLEVHFLDFSGDIYGKEVELIFLKRLRPIRKFDNPAELTRAIRKDISVASCLFSLQKGLL